MLGDFPKSSNGLPRNVCIPPGVTFTSGGLPGPYLVFRCSPWGTLEQEQLGAGGEAGVLKLTQASANPVLREYEVAVPGIKRVFRFMCHVCCVRGGEWEAKALEGITPGSADEWCSSGIWMGEVTERRCEARPHLMLALVDRTQVVDISGAAGAIPSGGDAARAGAGGHAEEGDGAGLLPRHGQAQERAHVHRQPERLAAARRVEEAQRQEGPHSAQQGKISA